VAGDLLLLRPVPCGCVALGLCAVCTRHCTATGTSDYYIITACHGISPRLVVVVVVMMMCLCRLQGENIRAELLLSSFTTKTMWCPGAKHPKTLAG
jgi:hypothetical protein